MKPLRPDYNQSSRQSLLRLEIVFAVAAGAMTVPFDLLLIVMQSSATHGITPYIAMHLLRGVIFALLTFAIWHWILPRLKGFAAIRLLVEITLGLATFGVALAILRELWFKVSGPLPQIPSLYSSASVWLRWFPSLSATLYMVLGGLALENARGEQRALRELALSAQLEVLRNQINHHFLFNALNLIAELTAVEPERAERMIIQLAEVLRYSLGASRRRLAALSDELAAVASYLEIEQARGGDNIRVEIITPVELADLQVPPLLIQPLVENAVRHGLQNGSRRGTIAIGARRKDSQLLITVEDDGVGLDPKRASQSDFGGVALGNLRQRLSAIYGPEANFQLRGGAHGGAIAEISLPLQKSVTAAPVVHGAAWRVFFGYIGSALAVAIYLSTPGHATTGSLMFAASLAEVIYLVIASMAGELKLLDLAFSGFLILGLAAKTIGSFDLFYEYGSALLYLVLAAVAIVPQALGFEAFSTYWGRLREPDWFQKTRFFEQVCNEVSMIWAAAYLIGAGLALRWPDSVLLAVVVPIAMLFVIVLPVTMRYAPLRIRLRSDAVFQSAEAFLRGLPMRFEKRLATQFDGAVQFSVSGAEPGNYYVEIRSGHCSSGEGAVSAPTVTVYCPSETWMAIARHEMPIARAVDRGMMRIRGGEENFRKFLACFNGLQPPPPQLAAA